MGAQFRPLKSAGRSSRWFQYARTPPERGTFAIATSIHRRPLMVTTDAASSPAIFAYLTVLEHAEHGFFGGYLIVCTAGRPLEFHCSAPVKPSPAQEILYGPTLRPYLLGQQIAGGLLAHAKLRPQLVITDQPEISAYRPQLDRPLVLLCATSDAKNVEDSVSGKKYTSPRHFHHAGYQFEIPVGYETDAEPVRGLLETLSACVDLGEPFERIHLAIREAQRIGESESEHDARAA